jgi:hypothetical protein
VLQLSEGQLRIVTPWLATYSIVFTGLIHVRDLTYPVPAGLVTIIAIVVSAIVLTRFNRRQPCPPTE